jgi:site-specific DNA-methyltransferase (adenine-specific)
MDVLPLIPDDTVDLVLVDLPYGQTDCSWDAIIPFEPMWAQLERLCKPNAVYLFFCSTKFGREIYNSRPKWFRYDLVWEKSVAVGHLNAKKMPLRAHEMVYVFSDPKYSHKTYNPQMTGDTTTRTREWKDGTYSTYSGRYPRSVVKYKCHEERLHPTQKPQDLCEWLVASYSNPDDVVLDFTMGSGTSIHAAKTLNRRYIGVERDETIFEIARRRILGEKKIRDIIKRKNKRGEEVDSFGEKCETYGALDTYRTGNMGNMDGLKNVYNKSGRGRKANANTDPLKGVFSDADERRRLLRNEAKANKVIAYGSPCQSA